MNNDCFYYDAMYPCMEAAARKAACKLGLTAKQYDIDELVNVAWITSGRHFKDKESAKKNLYYDSCGACLKFLAAEMKRESFDLDECYCTQPNYLFVEEFIKRFLAVLPEDEQYILMEKLKGTNGGDVARDLHISTQLYHVRVKSIRQKYLSAV